MLACVTRPCRRNGTEGWKLIMRMRKRGRTLCLPVLNRERRGSTPVHCRPSLPLLLPLPGHYPCPGSQVCCRLPSPLIPLPTAARVPPIPGRHNSDRWGKLGELCEARLSAFDTVYRNITIGRSLRTGCYRVQ